MDKSEYLKKYLSNAKDTTKQKPKKKLSANNKRIRIYDDDVDFKSLLPDTLSNTLDDDLDNNDPVVAIVVDERPKEVQELERFRKDHRWKVIGADLQDSESSSKVTAQQTRARHRHDSDSSASSSKAGKTYTHHLKGTNDGRKTVNEHLRSVVDKDLDLSPIRSSHESNISKQSRKYQDSDVRGQSPDSDLSPPRRKDQGHSILSLGKTNQRDALVSPMGRSQPASDLSLAKRKRHDSDISPPRRKRHDSDVSSRKEHPYSDVSPPRRKHHDSDVSPIRRERHDSDVSLPRREHHDSDVSPPRRKRHDSDTSPPRRKRQDSDVSPSKRKRHDSDVSLSRIERQDSDVSPPRRKRHDSDASPPRRKRHDSDLSPPRREHQDSDVSPPRRKRQDSDVSPPRRKRGNSNSSSVYGKNYNSDLSTARKKLDSDSLLPIIKTNSPVISSRNNQDDTDLSPPRRKRHDSDLSPPRKQQRDSDLSPPRKKHHNSVSSKRDHHDSDFLRKQHSDADLSPRRKGHEKVSSPSRNKRLDTKSENQTASGHKKMDKTLSGARAGLSSAAALKDELKLLKMKENEAFDKCDSEVLGKNAKAVVRGRLKEKEEEKARQDEKMAKVKEKYDTWSKGMSQSRMQAQAAEEALHEASKPLARYRDDEDLDEEQRNQEREGDPMLAFIKKKKSKAEGEKKIVYPMYKGPEPPPNRFNIRPGYRWDGVDRSNGFEKQLFAARTKRKVQEEEAKKWSMEDM